MIISPGNANGSSFSRMVFPYLSTHFSICSIYKSLCLCLCLSLSLSLYIYIYICMYICVCIYIYIYIYIVSPLYLHLLVYSRQRKIMSVDIIFLEVEGVTRC
jgi:hypothetical protein